MSYTTTLLHHKNLEPITIIGYLKIGHLQVLPI